MYRIALAALAAVIIIVSPAAAPRAQDNSLTRSDVETIIREYLLANPELLEEVFAELQAKRQVEADAARLDQLERHREALENSPLDPVLGNPEGDVTLVEFFDYNCGFCRRALEDIEVLLAEDPDLRIVLKEFPVLGSQSMEAATVSIAVHHLAPDRFAEFHEVLMTHEGTADRNTALEVAEGLGLSRADVEAAAEEPVVRQTVEQSYEIAQALGLTGTPSFVVGDNVEFGAVGVEALRESINETRCGEIVC